MDAEEGWVTGPAFEVVKQFPHEVFHQPRRSNCSMTKTMQLYEGLIAAGAVTPNHALTAAQLATKVGLDTKHASTALAQVATTRKGVLSRSLETIIEGERRQYKYWVTGPFQRKRHRKSYVRKGGNGHDNSTNMGAATTKGSYIMVIIGEKVRHQEVLTSEEARAVITRNI